MPQLVHHFLEDSARTHPDKVAVFQGEQCATYGEINSMADRLAVCLKENGVHRGERVLMVMENSVLSVIGYYGILKAGGVVVEVPDKSTLAEANYFIENCGARVGILSQASARRLEGLSVAVTIGADGAALNPGGIHFAWDQIASRTDTPERISLNEDDLAAVVYTSGSTGRPKGVMLSHRNLCRNTSSIVAYLRLTEHDRVMAVLPFYYVYGKTLLNTHFMVAGSLVINNRFAFPNAVIQDMLAKEVTGFAGVPSTFAILLNRSIFPKTELPHLRYITQAGGAMSPALTRRLVEHHKNADIFIMYGATEASARLTYLPPERLFEDKLGSIGIPIPEVQITIRDDKGHPLETGEVGNICASGPNIMQGYWNDPDETAKALKPWGLVTGDLGHMDEEGFIFLTGRRKEMLKIGGERVSPKEIEDAIMESHLVHEVAVIGHPDEYLSEVPQAYVVPLEPRTFVLDDLVAFTRQRLSVHKHPKYWSIITSIPKKPSGKIDKEALKS